jgi:hypothetical protein
MTRYQLQRAPKPGPVSDIEDPAFRSRVIAVAASGMSRRGVAAMVGKPESTIRSWVERGEAHPTVEPWGSFARDYRMAERGLEAAAAGAISLVTQQLYLLAEKAQEGDVDAMAALCKNPQMRELLNVLAARFPEDWGTSKHRRPDVEYDGAAWLESTGLQREQLGALFDDPPEPIRQALVDKAPQIYQILVQGGFDPTEERQPNAIDDDGGADGADGVRS